MDRRRMVQISGLSVGALVLGPRAFAVQGAVPVAATAAGKISGVVEEGINVFKGVPYGEDTAKTRFQPPRAPRRWEEVRECVAFGPMAPQIVTGRPPEHGGARTSAAGVPGAPRDFGEQSEDCLRLNVWTPGLRDRGKRPVLVYFHGGAYNNGTVNNDLYDGKRLCHRGDVVVVTVNHRLNGFGYMYLGDRAPEYEKSGNAGQLDLVLALDWVRENIEEFGGDPARVLIFGQSGGGAKCAALMATPVAHGLFTRVLTMSGQQIKGASVEMASERAAAVLEAAGIGRSVRGSALVAQLNGLTMQQIQAGVRTVSQDWLPVVDGVVLPRNPFDPDAPGLSKEVPMILGNTHDETSVAAPADLSWQQAPAVLQTAIAQYLGPYTAEQVVQRFREIHPDYTPLQVDVAAATAFRAWAGQRMEAERRAANPVSQPRTWVYQMDFRGANGRAMHTVDIPFMFDNVAMATGQIGTAPERLEVADRLAATMSGMLIAYAAMGNPNHAGMMNWPAYDLKRRATMVWNATAEVVDDPRGQERLFAEQAHYHQAGTPLP